MLSSFISWIVSAETDMTTHIIGVNCAMPKYSSVPYWKIWMSVVLESVLEGFSEYYSKNLARETRKGLREAALEARYTGDYIYSPVGNLKEHRSQPIIMENAIPAIVSKPQWEKVQAILHKRQTKGMVTAREPYLLSGLLFCGECGSPMSGHRSRKKKNGGEYVYYSYECQAKVRKHACRKRCVPGDEIETKILDYVKMLFSQQSVAYIQNYIQTHANELNQDILTQQEQIRKSAEKLDRKLTTRLSF